LTTLSANSWTERIESAQTPQELEQIHLDLLALESQSTDDAPLSDLERRRQESEESQEITLTDVKDPARRAKCKYDFRAFLTTYCHGALLTPQGRFLGFAPYQEDMIQAFQSVILEGGKKARAVRRGGFKSTIARLAAIWAKLYGHRTFIVLVGATDDKSEEHRDNFMQALKSLRTIHEDFPEVPVLLMKHSNPKKGLRLNGQLLTCSAKDSRGCILFPNIPGEESSGGRVAPYSLASTDISGLAFVDDVGRTIRPDLLLFDDVQTPQSAKSFMLTGKRENTITTTFMGLAALGTTMACIMVCTVREANDLTVRFCDRKLHPDWDGKMFPVLLHEPTDKQNWAIYGQKLREGATPQEGLELASAHYRDHRDAMDAGGVVAWEKDKEDGYISALQWCMTIAILQPEFFRCELQQKGAAPKGDVTQLDAEQLVKRLSFVDRGVVPSPASYLTGFVDSSDHVLWWMVCAWTKDFGGWIVDYGTWPDQGRSQFYKSDLQRMLEHELPGASWEEAFVHAHNKLDEYILGRTWHLQDGTTRDLDLLLKDWSDGGQKPRVESQVLASKFRSRIRPSKGFAPKPGKKRVHDYGDSHRDRNTKSDWVERRTENPMHVQFDANAWKNHVCRRLRTVPGSPSALMLPGGNEHDLTLLAEHLTAERAIAVEYDGSAGIVFEQTPDRDNDWFDCLVGNAVAASILGCSIPGEQTHAKQLRTFSLPGRR
jgi:hypothetical protein